MGKIKSEKIKSSGNDRERLWKYSLILLLFLLGYILFQQLKPYFSGALGALTLYILLRKPAGRLARKVNPTFSSSIMVIAVILFIIVPLSLLLWFIISKLQQVNWNPDAIMAPVMQVIDIVKEKTGFDPVSEKSIAFLASKLTLIGQMVINGIGDFAINIGIAVLLLFFLLQGGEKMEDYVASILPFRNVNKKEVIGKINVMVRSNAIGIPLLALIQGLLAWGGYMFFGVPNAFLAGFMTGLCSMVPIVGTMLIWLPMAVYFMIIGLWGKAVGLILFGAIIISQSDNLIRFILQKKMADTHPLITIFGVIVGLPVFGFIGIIFGPLLISLFLLFLDMFRKEYLLDSVEDDVGAADKPVPGSRDDDPGVKAAGSEGI